MAPNPIVIPKRKPVPEPKSRQAGGTAAGFSGLTWSLASTSLVVLLVATLPWARRWLYSAAAIESLLLIHGSAADTRILHKIPLWTLLASLNVVYAVASTSWLLYGFFAAGCYPLALFTCLCQFSVVSNFSRRRLRTLLRELHFTQDKIAFFDLPALEIDVDVNGLFVVRGLTISLSSLTIEAHGVELGLKLADDVELAISADKVVIQLFRRIDVDDVYANLKGGKFEMTFADLPEDASDKETDSMFEVNTPLLRAATGDSGGLKAPSLPPRPNFKRELTGGAVMNDVSPSKIFQQSAVRTVIPDDSKAETRYKEILDSILTTGHVYQSRQEIERMRGDNGLPVDNDKDMRAAICAKLQDMPSVPHPPARSIKVTTLKNSSPPWLRTFLHRLPFLLRLLLMPLSYFHPITFSAITAAGSGRWLTALLQEKIFKQFAAQDADIRRLEKRVCKWLADANFSLELCDIDGLGQVPLQTMYDVVCFLRFADIMAYRTMPESGVIDQVVRLGGADATFTIPSYLLPHHEHLLPPKPTTAAKDEQVEAIAEADGKPQQVMREKELEKIEKDETEVIMSIHASLPAAVDQSLLEFIAALVKATKLIEFEKEVDEIEEQPQSPTSPLVDSPIDSPASPLSQTTKAKTRFREFVKGAHQDMKEGMKSAHQDMKDGMKKAVVGGMVNDRWIAKLVGQIARHLERAQGDVGYSGGIPVALEPYRVAGEDLPKLLP